MVPAHLIRLDRLPLTANGKIDKAALPAPGPVTSGADLVPPRTLLETFLVDLYATLLGHEHVGAADSFFDAGGSSLLAMQLVTELRSSLAVDLDVSAIFVTPAPQQLAGLLRDKHGLDDAELDDESLDDLTPSRRRGALMLTEAQRTALAARLRRGRADAPDEGGPDQIRPRTGGLAQEARSRCPAGRSSSGSSTGWPEARPPAAREQAARPPTTFRRPCGCPGPWTRPPWAAR